MERRAGRGRWLRPPVQTRRGEFLATLLYQDRDLPRLSPFGPRPVPQTLTLTPSFTMSCGNPQTEPDALMQRKLLACVFLA